MATDTQSAAARPPDPPPPPPPPAESRNQERADRDGLRPTPEFRKGLDDFSARKEAGQASGELANPGERPTDKGLEPTQDFQQGLDDFRARKVEGQESGQLVDFSKPEQPDPSRPDAAQPDRSRPDAAQPDADRPDPAERANPDVRQTVPGDRPQGGRDGDGSNGAAARPTPDRTENNDPDRSAEEAAPAVGNGPDAGADGAGRPAEPEREVGRPANGDASVGGSSGDKDRPADNDASRPADPGNEGDRVRAVGDAPPSGGPPGGGGGPPHQDGPPGAGPPADPPRDHVDRDDGEPMVITSFLAPSGDQQVDVRAVDPSDVYPGWQDDNNGKDPPRDYRTDTSAHPDGVGLESQHRPMYDALREADPPSDTLYKGGTLSEDRIDGWKQALLRGDEVTFEADALSTSRDPVIGLTYGESDPGQTAGQRARLDSQSYGRPIGTDDIEPGPSGDHADVARNQNVPGHEVLARGDFATQYAARMASAVELGDTAAVERLERLHDAVASSLDPAGNLAAAPYTEGVRRDGMDERVLSGNYELVGLLDTRVGHEFRHGEVSSVMPPGGGDPPPGVYPVFAPRRIDGS